MERRTFLVGGASLGLAQAASAGEGIRYDPEAVEAALGRVDARMQSLGEADFSFRSPTSAADAELLASRTRLGRSATRSLYFLGAFLEMEEHERLHPGVQLRLRRLLPEVSAAIEGTTELIESLGPEDHRALQATFRQDPDLASRVGEELQRVAREDGFGFTRRLDLRVAVERLGGQLKSQNPALLLDPMARKVRRIQASLRSNAEQQRIQAIRTGEEAFWNFQQRSLQAVAAWDAIYATRPAAAYLGALESTYPESPPAKQETERNYGPGLIVAGIGLGIGIIGGILYAAGATGPGAVMGITVGPILLLIGIIMLIVQAAK